MPWPSLPSAPHAPAVPTGPWLRLRATGPAGPAAWPPATLPGAATIAVSDAAPTGDEPEAAPPGRLYDEAEVARLTAEAAAAAAQDATDAARRQVTAREVAMLERLAAELLLAREARQEADLAARRQLAQIATTIARTLLRHAGEDSEHAFSVVAAMLDGLPATSGAKLVVDASTAAALEGRLPELVRQAGFPIALETESEPGRAPGSLRLIWDGGWAEHDPEATGRQIAELLAAHAAPQCAAESRGE